MAEEKVKKSKMSVSLKASLAYTICSILQKCLSLFTMPLFTRLLTQEEYGQYSIYVSWSSIISIVLTLNLAFGSFSNAMVKFKGEREKYISSIQTLVLVLCGIFLVVYLPFNSFFNGLFKLPTYLMVLMVFDILTCFALQCWYGLKRFEFKYRSVIAVTLLCAVLSPAMALLLIKLMEAKGEARILGYIIINVLIGGAIFLLNYVKSKGRIKKEHIVYALKFNIPLLVYYISQVIFNQSDRIMIEHFAGLDKAAIYSVAYTIALILLFVLNSINNAYVPWLYEGINANKYKGNKNVSTIIFVIMCTLVGGLIWIAPEIVLIMAGEPYKEAIYIIPPIATSLIVLLLTQYFVNVEFYYEEKKQLVYASILSAILNIILNYLFIPRFGYVFAGYTTLISYVAFCLCNYLAVRKTIRKGGKLEGIYDMKLLLILLAGFFALSYVGVLLYDYFYVRLGIILGVILLLAIFSKKIYAFVMKYFKKQEETEPVLEGIASETDGVENRDETISNQEVSVDSEKIEEPKEGENHNE